MIIIDSGNTNCKMWVGEHQILKSYSEKFTESEVEFFKNDVEFPVIFSTVAPQKFEKIAEMLRNIGFKKFINVGEFVKKENLLGETVQGIGADRILGMIGAATFLKTPLITVDCGTAVTVNFLKEENLCIGGAIFAGYSTQLRALTENTEGIRFKENQLFKNAIGQITEEALQSGILHSIAGGIQILYKNFLKEAKIEKANVVITGGDGELIFKKLKEEKFECVFKNDLIKLGIEDVLKKMDEQQKEKYSIA